MQNKSSLNINNGEHYNSLMNDLPAKEFSAENTPIHSMQKDLEMLKNPPAINRESPPLPVSPDSKYTSSAKISPFLEKADLAPIVSASQEKSKESLAGGKVPKQEMSGSSKPSASKKVFVFFIILLSLIALGFGSYYFWLIRGEKTEILSEESPTANPVSNPIEESASPTAIVEPEIKTEEIKENVIVLDLENSNSAKIKTEIRNQIEKLPRESFNKPVEFKFRDLQNNSLNFSLFAKKSGLAFSQNLLNYLGESFSLFAFNDGSNLGTGLIIESKNDPLLTQEMLKEEAALPKHLDVLFLPDVPSKTTKVSFSNFTYKDISLRYFNLISQEKLSIDYAIVKNKFLVGTTRNTFIALCDWLSVDSEKK